MKIVKVFYVTCRKFAKYVLVDEGEARDKNAYSPIHLAFA